MRERASSLDDLNLANIYTARSRLSAAAVCDTRSDNTFQAGNDDFSLSRCCIIHIVITRDNIARGFSSYRE